METPDTREWLSANGLGGYAGGTVTGANSRRYHGLLVAALEPPGKRTVLLQRVDETVVVSGEIYELGTSFWQSGWTAPEGFHHLASFRPAPVPTWEYRVGLDGWSSGWPPSRAGTRSRSATGWRADRRFVSS